MHPVRDWCKVRYMIRALRRGEQLPTIYMDGPLGSGNWLSGTHRVAASEIRAKLDGLQPYQDLQLFDITQWSEKVGEEVREEWNSMWEDDPEEACKILDQAEDSQEFEELVLAIRQTGKLLTR